MQGKKQKWFLKALLVYFAGNNNLEALNELLKFMKMSHFCGVSHMKYDLCNVLFIINVQYLCFDFTCLGGLEGSHPLGDSVRAPGSSWLAGLLGQSFIILILCHAFYVYF